MRDLDEEDEDGPEDDEPALTPEWADSYRHLATILGVPKSTVFQWRKMPGAPKPDIRKRQNVDEWRAFMAANQLGQEVSEEEAAVKLRKLKAEAEYRELLVAIKKREYVRYAVVVNVIQRVVPDAVNVMRDKYGYELPPICAGRSAVEIQQENLKALHEACEKISVDRILEMLEDE